VIATLADVADAVEAAKLPAPALVIVGEVVDRRVVVDVAGAQVNQLSRASRAL
jgi:siroheme synthase